MPIKSSTEGTKIYGLPDNFIKFEGDISGQVNCQKAINENQGALLICSDGTVLEARLSKSSIIEIDIFCHKKGELFKAIDRCDDEDAPVFSDTAYFKPGLEYIHAATEWERVQ